MVWRHPLPRKSRDFAQHCLDILLDHLAAPLRQEVGVAEGVSAGALPGEGSGGGDGLFIEWFTDQCRDTGGAAHRGAAHRIDCLAQFWVGTMR